MKIKTASTSVMNEWISVSERLPSKLEEVLCCNIDGIFSIGYIRHWDSRIECVNHPFIMPDVIAWMPLPEPYKQKSQKSKGETDESRN